MSNFRRKLMVLLVLGAVIFIGAPTQAVEKKSERTLAEIVDMVMKDGKEKTIDEESGRNLGFPGEIKIKSMRYRSENCPDGQEHAFNVFFSSTPKGELSPEGILWRVAKVTNREAARFIDGWALRLSLDGKLSNAFKVEGELGVEVLQTVKEIKSLEVQKIFEKERKFFLKDSVKLPFNK